MGNKYAKFDKKRRKVKKFLTLEAFLAIERAFPKFATHKSSFDSFCQKIIIQFLFFITHSKIYGETYQEIYMLLWMSKFTD